MFRRSLLTFAAMLGMVASDAAAQERSQRTMRFAEMDANNDGRITRREWRGSDRSFAVHDWNRDGVLSGDEVRPGSRRRGRENEPEGFDSSEREYQFTDWTARGFTALDHNRDGRISRAEWHGTAERFDALDDNRDGTLTRVEMRGGTEPPPDLFTNVDVNRDGVIARDEWHWSRASFDRRDANRDGRLSRQEFVQDTPPTPSEAWRQGHERGLAEGRQAGREDRERNQGWDLEGQRELETADSGYEQRFGARTDYQAGYREGFRRGYREGFGPR